MKIIAFVIAITTLGIVQAAPESKAVEALKTATNLAGLVSEYIAHTQTFPGKEEGLSVLVSAPRTPPIPRQWMMLVDELPKDPWGNDFVYTISDINEEKNQARLGILSKGADGKLHGGDDVFISWVAKLP